MSSTPWSHSSPPGPSGLLLRWRMCGKSLPLQVLGRSAPAHYIGTSTTDGPSPASPEYFRGTEAARHALKPAHGRSAVPVIPQSQSVIRKNLAMNR